MPLPQSEVERYAREGWAHLGRLLDADRVEALRAEERRFRLPQAYGGPDNASLFVNVQLCHRSEAIRELAIRGPQIPALVALAGPNLCLTHQQFVTKLPDRGEQRSDVPWHQDDGYGPLDPMTDVTVWIPLIDTDARNGGIQIVPGSHLGGVLPHDRSGINPVLIETAKPENTVAVDLAAGEAIAFSGLTLHGSGPNHGDVERPALFLRYCDPHARMLSEGGRPVLEDAHSWMVAGEA
ncbi:MAG: phytanoyl-CoA dioxygenase family protein [Myxococcota bacterium]|nr:phytanoyl-CoA dioxygenase family protein [Myxococcota bacterium]